MSLLSEEFKNIGESLTSGSLPKWEDFPNIELYMDQLIYLLNQYLESEVSTPITQAMINNYVKQKAIPAPIKKRYSKIHLAYLIIFCTLKQTLNISAIQKIIPVDLNEEEILSIYNSFLSNRQKASLYAKEQMQIITTDTFSADTDNVNQTRDAVMQISSIANVFKILTEKIINNNEYETDEKGAVK